jgi:glycosyltransferase involved in cell wall biosynthesis
VSRISVLHLTFDMRIGGTEMVIKNLIEGSDHDVFEMSIFCIEKPIGPWGLDLQKSGIQITAKARKPSFDTSIIKAIRRHLKENRIDVIHCHQYTPWVYGALAAMGTKTKVIFTEHGRFYPDSSSWKRKLINPWLCRMTDHITAISKSTKQSLIDFENIPEIRIDVIYNGIKPLVADKNNTIALRAKHHIPHDSKILGTVARLDPIKNQEMMIKAFYKVLKTHPKTFLLIVGDGEERQVLQSLVDELKLKPNVIFTGYDANPVNLINLMDVFLLSSFSEGTSMTLLEAMSLGKPCVVTDAGGNREVISHGESGLVAMNNDENDYVDKIKTMLDESCYITHRSQIIERFQSLFSDKAMIKMFIPLYSE